MNDLTLHQQLFESDTHSLFGLVVTRGAPVAEGNIRLASAILRKWVCEGELNRLCHQIGATPTFPVVQNDHIRAIIQLEAGVEMYLTGGVLFDGDPLTHVVCTNESAAFTAIQQALDFVMNS